MKKILISAFLFIVFTTNAQTRDEVFKMIKDTSRTQTEPVTMSNFGSNFTAPQAGTLLQLISNGIGARISNDTYASGVNGSIFQGRRADGTPDAPTAAQSGMVLSGINGDGYGTSSFTGSGIGSMTIRAEENFTNTSKATNIQGTVTTKER